MSERFGNLCAAVCVLGAIFGFAAGASAQATLEANGPVQISEEKSLISLPVDDGFCGPPDSAAVAPTISPAESEPKTAGIEHKPLGRPHSILAAKTDAASAQPKPQNILEKLDPRGNEITKVIGALAVVLGLLLIVRATMKKVGGGTGSGSRPSGVLEVLARYPVGRGQTLVLIKLARRIVLAHQSGSTMTALSEVTDQNEVAALLSRLEAGSNPRDAAKFKKTFAQFMSEQSGGNESAATLPIAEVIDLTKTPVGSTRWFAWKGRP